VAALTAQQHIGDRQDVQTWLEAHVDGDSFFSPLGRCAPLMSNFALGSPTMPLRRSDATGLRSAFGRNLPVGHRESTESPLATAVCCTGIDLPASQSVSRWSDGSSIRHFGCDGDFGYANKPASWGIFLKADTMREPYYHSAPQPRAGILVEAAAPGVRRRTSALMRSGPETDCRDAARRENDSCDEMSSPALRSSVTTAEQGRAIAHLPGLR
jgi:hypothetical protein